MEIEIRKFDGKNIGENLSGTDTLHVLDTSILEQTKEVKDLIQVGQTNKINDSINTSILNNLKNDLSYEKIKNTLNENKEWLKYAGFFQQEY